jgi:hypothetical protein
MARGLVLILAVAALTGCHQQWGTGSSSISGSASADDAAAQANVRASIPAIEAYYADNGTYEAATLETLRSLYDAGLPDVVIVSAERETYCVESTVGGVSYFKAGPAADIWPGQCGDAPPPEPPAPVHTDAEDLVLSVVPAIEAYHAQNGTYAGLEQTRDVNGVSLSQVRIRVLKNGTAYCVEGPRQAASAHFVGPAGPLAPGPC